jgi:hypothetical protein
LKIPSIVLSDEEQISSFSGTWHHMHPRRLSEAQAISTVVKHYSWEHSVVISSQSERSISMEKLLDWDPTEVMSFVDGLSNDIAALLIGKGFKPLGTRIAVFLTEGNPAKQLLQAAEVKNVAISGYGFLLGQ